VTTFRAPRWGKWVYLMEYPRTDRIVDAIFQANEYCPRHHNQPLWHKQRTTMLTIQIASSSSPSGAMAPVRVRLSPDALPSSTVHGMRSVVYRSILQSQFPLRNPRAAAIRHQVSARFEYQFRTPASAFTSVGIGGSGKTNRSGG
jgi:hypothetical protein